MGKLSFRFIVSSTHFSIIDGCFYKNGAPFFWLADTAWGLFWRLDRSEVVAYLEKRAAQGFTVVMASLLFEIEFFETVPVCGHFPFIDGDPTRPNKRFWEEVDWRTRKANELGLTMAFLPSWGDKWFDPTGEKYSILTPENARVYGEFLGERYKNTDHLWILGGDRAVTQRRHFQTLDALAMGIKAADEMALLGFHPNAEGSPKALFGDKWLDFSLLQTGHGIPNISNFRRVREEIEREPRQIPVFDGEPIYEDHPLMQRTSSGWERANGFYAADLTVRKKAWHALFAGACGHAYGAHAVWQFFDGVNKPLTWPRTDWQSALELPGARQMGLMRSFFESLGADWSKLRPDLNLLLETTGEPNEEVGALISPDKTLGLIYTPNDHPFWVNLPYLGASTILTNWFDPRTGSQTNPQQFSCDQPHQFHSPFYGEDAVLLLRA